MTFIILNTTIVIGSIIAFFVFIWANMGMSYLEERETNTKLIRKRKLKKIYKKR